MVCPGSETVNTYPFSTIDATLVLASRQYNPCLCVNQWIYTISYDDTQLVEDAVILATDLTGLFCKGCLVNWAEEKIGSEIYVRTNEDESQTVISQHGCEYPLVASGGGVVGDWIEHPITTAELTNATSVFGAASEYREDNGMIEWHARVEFIATSGSAPCILTLPPVAPDAPFYTDNPPAQYTMAWPVAIMQALGTSPIVPTWFPSTGRLNTGSPATITIPPPIGSSWNTVTNNMIMVAMRYRTA